MEVSGIGFHVQPSPVGDLLLAATDAGVCLVDWGDPDAALARLERERGAPARRSRSLGPIARQLEEYFAGRRRSFTAPLDLSSATPFRRRVLERLARVPFGALTTYGDLARALRSGPRAVGGAVGANPVPVLVPCHRVIASDGTLGGFGGGLERKRTLLSLEGHDPFEGGWVARRDLNPPGAPVPEPRAAL
ncbi:MAG TPA: methylated-DNA--[protein]-cysteine S-methyltransferase [Actinomycetota bacterium]|nr:methylated-DNA--[protein]-cysteine S-methyltransferase [Actinomycetota bacterium]